MSLPGAGLGLGGHSSALTPAAVKALILESVRHPVGLLTVRGASEEPRLPLQPMGTQVCAAPWEAGEGPLAVDGSPYSIEVTTLTFSSLYS